MEEVEWCLAEGALEEDSSSQRSLNQARIFYVLLVDGPKLTCSHIDMPFSGEMHDD